MLRDHRLVLLILLPEIHIIVVNHQWLLLEASSVRDDAVGFLVDVEVGSDVQFVGWAPVEHGRPVVLLSLVGQAFPIERTEALCHVAMEIG